MEEKPDRLNVTFHSSTKTIKRPLVTATDRWRHTMLEVLDSKMIIDQEQLLTEERDAVGDCITKILNQNPGFRRLSEAAIEERHEKNSVGPLFSYKNMCRLYQLLRTFRPSPQSANFIALNVREWLHYIIRDRKSMLEGICILVGASVLASLIVTLSYKAIVLWFVKIVMIVAMLASTFLVDVNEIKDTCPIQIVSMAERCLALLRWIDGYLLLGRQYARREWNLKRHVSSPEAPSTRISLIKCPPPEKEREDWSHRTRKHVSAINFCYSMLKIDQDNLAKKHKPHKRAASGSVLDTASARSLPQFQSKFDRSIRSRHMSLGDEALVWQSNDNANVASVSDEGCENSRRSCTLERPRAERATSDDSSTFKRSYSDSDVFSAIGSDEDTVSNEQDDRSHRRQNTDTSLESDNGDDMGWVEVGARIGMRILSSEHVQRAVASQDTAERFLDISKKVETKFGSPTRELMEARRRTYQTTSSIISRDDAASEVSTVFSDSRSLIMPIKPVHSMWTSASAVLPSSRDSLSCVSTDTEDAPKSSHPPLIRRLSSEIEAGSLPPRSPAREFRKAALRRQGSTGSTSKSVSFDIKQCAWLPDEKTNPNSYHAPTGTGHIMDQSEHCRSPEQDVSMEVVLVSEHGMEGEQVCPTKEIYPVRVSACPISKAYSKRSLLKPGVKVVVPIFPIQPRMKHSAIKRSGQFFQMGTVVSSKRTHVRTVTSQTQTERTQTNCLSITVNLDKSFLRDGAFAQMTLRIMDSWSDRYMPRHSKFPIGACIATSYGIGILVGWRVEDDFHIVRSLWQRRGPGAANAYLNRDALHCIVEASIGFTVDTALGSGVVVSYVNAGKEFENGRYFVNINEAGRHKGATLGFNRSDILACHGPEFVPVIELIREAAEYQIQVDTYELAMRRQMHGSQILDEMKWLRFSKGFEIIWSSLLKAVEDDEGFDAGVNEFFASVIKFLDQLEKEDLQRTGDSGIEAIVVSEVDRNEVFIDDNSGTAVSVSNEKQNPYDWLVNDVFGGIFGQNTSKEADDEVKTDAAFAKRVWNQQQYDKAYAVIRALMRTVTIAKADCKEMPDLKLALAIAYEFLLFVRTVVRIQQKNVSAASLAVWERAIDEVIATFGPVKVRLEKIGHGIAERIQKHGNKTKIRIIRLVDILASDETLLLGLERGEWKNCLNQVEQALVLAGIIQEDSRENYHKTIKFMFNHFAPVAKSGSAAARTNEKMVSFAKVLKWLTSPRRSLLKLVRNDVTLEILQRIFDRVFRNDPEASLMIAIHASNMTSIRQLRMLKDFTISGKLWMPMLDAADQEFAWVVSKISGKSKSIMLPLSKLFSLGVAQFHKIAGGDLTADWMDFLMEEQAIRLIHEIDVELILQVEAFSKDVQEVMMTLPFFPSIDDDILNLVDELDIDKFLKEASAAMVDSDQLAKFIRDKSAIAIQRFLDYLPKMSIPVEQRDLGDNWVITCHSENGGDLTLSDVCIKRENLSCQVMGGETMLFPAFHSGNKEHVDDVEIVLVEGVIPSTGAHQLTPSILDHIYELLLNAQNHGCWQSGIGGVGQQPSDPYAASVLKGIPISAVLNTGIELWRSLEIDDDELMEIAIKDVSFQIQLHQQREEGMIMSEPLVSHLDTSISMKSVLQNELSPRRRFNPRVDPTLFYLKMKKFTVKLDKFRFRIEKKAKTIFDPVFEGWGKLSVENISISIRVECHKERTLQTGIELMVPVLQCRELKVTLEKVILEVSDTGADWILNKAVKQFSKDFTTVVQTNLQDQVRHQVHTMLDNLNSYLQINPDLMLRILGITIDDLEENLVWV